MIFYFILFVLISIILVVPKTSLIDLRTYIFLVILSLAFSVREYNVGTDTLNYINSYLYSSLDDSTVEIGYKIFVEILRYFNFNVSCFLFFVSFFSLIGLLFFYRENSKNYIIAIILGFLFGYFFLNINIFRQAISISFVAFSLLFYINKKWGIFIFFSILAFLFHKSSLIFIIPLLFIYLFKNKNILYISYFVFSLGIVAFNDVFNNLIDGEKRYTGYIAYNEGGGSGLIFFNVALLFLFFIFGRGNNFLVKYFSFGVFIGLPLLYLGVHPSGPLRLVYYFFWVSPVIITNIISESSSKKSKVFFYFILIFFSLIYFYFFVKSIGGLENYKLGFIGVL